MAGICVEYGGRSNVATMNFVCDSVSEVKDLPTTTKFGKGIFANYKQCAPIGSVCIVGNEGGSILVYMLFSFGWKQLPGGKNNV